jgi:lon-related putative ATP-dependent protease
MQMTKVQPLDPGALYTRTNPQLLNFQTTEELTEPDQVVGQPRAAEALRFGIGINQEGYNLYAMGPAGTGKRSLVHRYFSGRAGEKPVPEDWVYVHNFRQQHKPVAISLPPGRGAEFQQDMQTFVDELRTALGSVFEGDEYRARRQAIEQEVQEEHEQTLEGVQKQAREQNFALIRTPAGLVLAPMREGEALSPEEFQNLPEEERKQVEAHLEALQKELQEAMQKVPALQRKARERLKTLHREMTDFAVGGLIQELKTRYAELQKVVQHLDAVQEDVVENAADFMAAAEEQGSEQNLMAVLAARARSGQQASLDRYKVNLLVDRREKQGAPVVVEDNPSYQNLVGRVEHTAQMGALMTDFSLIKPGVLHEANGGYLILDARKLLTQPFAWEALKRALQSKCIRIESLGQMLSAISTVTLEPEPIPLDVKVALIGDRLIYYLLAEHDPDFLELFKVQVDFEEQMDRNGENQMLYARLLAAIIQENDLKPFNREAVARVIEHSARMVSDSERLSTELRDMTNLLREAHYWSSENGSGVVTADDVQRAIDAQIYRADRLRERVAETILRGTFLIDTQGEQVGQVNGLSVISLGGFAFGRPSRITARVRMGKGELVNIEREVELSGPIHSKGVLILSGFLGSRYAQDRPMSLAASLVFEQSYGGVDGDSASSAELYALLSAIARVPLKQSLAVTGAINQMGQVQAIGGVNEKIEGFFDICKARGLTGEQGVLIPSTNVKHLMLRQDVIEAVQNGQFQIYPVEHVDQGIELLSGMPAGEAGENGVYPSDTINGKVQARLEELAEKARQLNAPQKEENA